MQRRLACPEGIEPPTHSLEGCCSIQLSYGQKRELSLAAGGWGRGAAGDGPKENAPGMTGGLVGRSDRIRTYDPLVPNQMRYQTALRSEAAILAAGPHQSFTYSYSTGLALMPRSGGAIHAAILPGSTTRCIRLLT